MPIKAIQALSFPRPLDHERGVRMPRSAVHLPRVDFRGLAAVCLIVTIAPSLLAEKEETGAVAGTIAAEPNAPAFTLMKTVDLTRNSETAGFELVALSGQSNGDQAATAPGNSSPPS